MPQRMTQTVRLAPAVPQVQNQVTKNKQFAVWFDDLH